MSRVAGRVEPLSWGQRRFLFVLATPAFGVAFAYTLVTTYVPVLLNELSGPAITGILIGAEGVVALAVPVLVGSWSDRLRTKIGGRLPFVLAAAAIAVAALIMMPLGAGSLTWVAVTLGVFFIAYFAYYAPYYALYPDLVPEQARGRSQGFLGGLRSAGMLLALAGGGFMLSVWLPMPFVIGAAAVVIVTVVLLFGVRKQVGRTNGDSRGGGFGTPLRMLLEHRAVRNWALANVLWEAAIAALRTFVVLYFTVGLEMSLTGTSSALALVGLTALLAAPVSGKLADRYGARPVMRVAVWVFALGLLPTLLTTNKAYIAGIVPVAFAAVVLITLPYAILMRLMPERSEHGAGAGLFELSRGVGVVAGPLMAGFATAILDGVDVLTFADTRGYAAIFGVAALLLIASVAFLNRITISDDRDAEATP